MFGRAGPNDLRRSLRRRVLRHALLHLSGEMRHQTDHALKQHELTAVVHLVLLWRQEHLETRFGRRLCAGGHRDGFRKLHPVRARGCRLLR